MKQREVIENYNWKLLKIVPIGREKTNTAIWLLELWPDNACSYVKPMIINTSALRASNKYDIYSLIWN